jgi:hypothetical protein
MRTVNCKTCGQPFNSKDRHRYCSDDCRWRKAPAVYRFCAPDGRSYVGAVGDSRRRADEGLRRSNARLVAAFEQHPSETWTYEILELLPPGCSLEELRAAEQRHIDRLRSREPDAGFNILRARSPKHDSVLSK